MIALTNNGDFAVDETGHLTTTSTPDKQNFMSEVRCLQGTYEPQPDFGRNPLVWGLSQSPKDRIDDLVRISKKYVSVQAITYNPVTKVFNIT